MAIRSLAQKTNESRTSTRKPRQNFETWSWYFMRISGLVLFFVAPFHFFIMHILNDVTATNVTFVANRWNNPIWRLFDWLLLALGLLHGSNGLRFIMDDYIRKPGKRVAVKSVVYGIAIIMFIYGTLTIVTFKG